ncbi:MAG: DUF6048 family protein [Bacteroidales bacterium]|nr:DUF6048 family protein [Bacteroidales bacterium]
MNKHLFFMFLTTCLLVCSYALGENADSTVVKKHKVDTVYCGWSLQADIASPLMGLTIDKSVRTAEIAFDVNLFNKIFPTVELGYGQVATTANSEASYSTAAPFWRIGFNYNIMRRFDDNGNPKPTHNYPFVGLRYGMTVMNYTMTNVPVSDDYWGGSSQFDYNYRNAYVGWLEILAGVRVDLVKGFTMGWAIRMKMAAHAKTNKALLWYVPGLGHSDGLTFSFSYTIGFTYRTKAEREKVEKIRLEENKREYVTLKK